MNNNSYKDMEGSNSPSELAVLKELRDSFSTESSSK